MLRLRDLHFRTMYYILMIKIMFTWNAKELVPGKHIYLIVTWCLRTDRYNFSIHSLINDHNATPSIFYVQLYLITDIKHRYLPLDDKRDGM